MFMHNSIRPESPNKTLRRAPNTPNATTKKTTTAIDRERRAPRVASRCVVFTVVVFVVLVVVCSLLPMLDRFFLSKDRLFTWTDENAGGWNLLVAVRALHAQGNKFA